MKRTLLSIFVLCLCLLLVDCRKKSRTIDPDIPTPSPAPQTPPPDRPAPAPPPIMKPPQQPPKTLPPPPAPKKRSPAPGDSAALRLVESGVKELNSGNLDSADQIFEQALRVSPNNGKPYYYLGVVAFRRKEYDRALAFLSQAETKLGNDSFWMSQVLMQQGLVYKSTSQKERARQKFQQALKEDPSNSVAKKELGTLR